MFSKSSRFGRKHIIIVRIGAICYQGLINLAKSSKKVSEEMKSLNEEPASLTEKSLCKTIVTHTKNNLE